MKLLAVSQEPVGRKEKAFLLLTFSPPFMVGMKVRVREKRDARMEGKEVVEWIIYQGIGYCCSS